MVRAGSSVVIPSLKGESENVVFWADELPIGGGSQEIDIVDVLRGELAPLSVWRDCAVSLGSPFHCFTWHVPVYYVYYLPCACT